MANGLTWDYTNAWYTNFFTYTGYIGLTWELESALPTSRQLASLASLTPDPMPDPITSKILFMWVLLWFGKKSLGLRLPTQCLDNR